MGRHLKNRELPTASYSVRLPMGANAIGPNAPVEGLIRYNYEIDQIQVYSNNSWRIVKTLDGTEKTIFKDTFYGDGNTRNFGAMRYSYNPGDEIKILVFIGNVHQNPGVAYNVDGDKIEFTSAPPMGHTIVIMHGFTS
jgi:hypothetical protein